MCLNLKSRDLLTWPLALNQARKKVHLNRRVPLSTIGSLSFCLWLTFKRSACISISAGVKIEARTHTHRCRIDFALMLLVSVSAGQSVPIGRRLTRVRKAGDEQLDERLRRNQTLTLTKLCVRANLLSRVGRKFIYLNTNLVIERKRQSLLAYCPESCPLGVAPSATNNSRTQAEGNR